MPPRESQWQQLPKDALGSEEDTLRSAKLGSQLPMETRDSQFQTPMIDPVDQESETITAVNTCRPLARSEMEHPAAPLFGDGRSAEVFLRIGLRFQT